MKIRRLLPNGSTPILLVLLIVVLGAAGFAGWKVYSQANPPKPVVSGKKTVITPKEPKNFDECVALKDSVIKTSPSTCTTRAGAIFVKTAVVKTALDIEPWHIRLPLTISISDAFYTKLANGTIRLSSDQMQIALNSMEGCHAGFEDMVYQRARPGDLREGKSYSQEDLQKLGIKVGDYYYFPVPQVAQTCTIPATALTEEAVNLRRELQAAFNMAQPY